MYIQSFSTKTEKVGNTINQNGKSCYNHYLSSFRWETKIHKREQMVISIIEGHKAKGQWPIASDKKNTRINTNILFILTPHEYIYIQINRIYKNGFFSKFNINHIFIL